MRVVSFTSSPPQHIGDTDGRELLADLLAGARRGRHAVRVALRVVQGNDVSVYLFDTAERCAKVMGAAINADLVETDRATWQDPTGEIVLVACCKTKLDHAAPARDLYCSPWFQKARAYAEAKGCPWFILSAEHGLVSPDTVLAPYETAMANLGEAARLAWSRRVLAQLVPHTIKAARVTILAGEPYRETLAAALTAQRLAVVVPMAGLGLGHQLAWLTKANAAPAAAPASEVVRLANGAADQLLIEGVPPIGDTVRQLAAFAAKREARRGSAPAGGLFDDGARAQRDLFG